MDERKRVMRDIIKVLPEAVMSLTRSASGDAAAMRAATGQTEATPAPTVPPGQLRALIHLAQHGAQTMGELAEGLRVTMASASGLVKPLVEVGYVTRTRDPQDRRVVRVGLSERAQAVADRIMTDRLKELETALAAMDDAACDNFLEGLERLAGLWR